MTFYILMNQITAVFLGLNLLTTLTFDSEIQSYLYGGGKDEVFFQVTNNHRTLVMKSLRENGLSNLLVITSKRKYYFQLYVDKENPHQFVEVRNGLIGHALKKKIVTADYEILEGGSSLLFVNRKNVEVDVNGKKVKSREYFSKGVPIIYEHKRILN